MRDHSRKAAQLPLYARLAGIIRSVSTRLLKPVISVALPFASTYALAQDILPEKGKHMPRIGIQSSITDHKTTKRDNSFAWVDSETIKATVQYDSSTVCDSAGNKISGNYFGSNATINFGSSGSGIDLNHSSGERKTDLYDSWIVEIPGVSSITTETDLEERTENVYTALGLNIVFTGNDLFVSNQVSPGWRASAVYRKSDTETNISGLTVVDYNDYIGSGSYVQLIPISQTFDLKDTAFEAGLEYLTGNLTAGLRVRYEELKNSLDASRAIVRRADAQFGTSNSSNSARLDLLAGFRDINAHDTENDGLEGHYRLIAASKVGNGLCAFVELSRFGTTGFSLGGVWGDVTGDSGNVIDGLIEYRTNLSDNAMDRLVHLSPEQRDAYEELLQTDFHRFISGNDKPCFSLSVGGKWVKGIETSGKKDFAFESDATLAIPAGAAKVIPYVQITRPADWRSIEVGIDVAESSDNRWNIGAFYSHNSSSGETKPLDSASSTVGIRGSIQW